MKPVIKASIRKSKEENANHEQTMTTVLFPLLMSGMLNKVDIEAEVWGSVGQSKQAIAVRYGIARGLFHFVDEETKQNMRIAGLLTKDPRNAERKKPGQEGARRKFTWKKR
ncbi:unnamed protein product [Bemisia tabaci]|uniref:Ribosomal protein S9 n=1 Tax=Bemisia tabaci TaxID=7038 RepID=A0A9P0A6C2_BEMTA|nr:unnamed protein product [Bemisia tabaci]